MSSRNDNRESFRPSTGTWNWGLGQSRSPSNYKGLLRELPSSSKFFLFEVEYPTTRGARMGDEDGGRFTTVRPGQFGLLGTRKYLSDKKYI